MSRGSRAPSASALQGVIARISAKTWERINHAILVSASVEGIEDGKMVRTDATAVESDIHHPTDSSLLNDAVRVMCRRLKIAEKSFPNLIRYRNCTRVVKKLAYSLAFKSRKANKPRVYKQILKHAGATLDSFRKAWEEIPTEEPR